MLTHHRNDIKCISSSEPNAGANRWPRQIKFIVGAVLIFGAIGWAWFWTRQPETRRAVDDEPFSALVFKLQNDPYVGTLAFFRVYSGKARIGSVFYNSVKDEEEREEKTLL